jgi:hypothetical protein
LQAYKALWRLIKKVSKTVDDVSSLAPVLGKYWDAKSVATKAAVQAKKSKSSMSIALQIELVLDESKRFEDQLQLLFMQSGRIDTWNKIKSRAAAMDVESAHDARREKEAAARRKAEMDEAIELDAVGACLFQLAWRYPLFQPWHP